MSSPRRYGIDAHKDFASNDHRFAFYDAKVISGGNTKGARLKRVPWNSEETAINRHIYLYPAYQVSTYDVEKK